MIYILGTNSDPFVDNPGLKLVEEYARLEPRQFTFVCLVCDPSRDNPVGTLIGRERRIQAAKLAGYRMESDGKRLDKNGRNAVYGQVKSIEAAIVRFKELHYNEIQRSKDVIKKQIAEIRDFLESEKVTPLIYRGKVVLDAEGKERTVIDQRGLELAQKLGTGMAALHEALQKLEDMDPAREDTPEFDNESSTLTVSDLEDVDLGDDNAPLIERIHNLNAE